jgi:hypothetical protein
MAEELLRRPERDADAIERADQMTSRVRLGVTAKIGDAAIMVREAHAEHRPAGRPQVGAVPVRTRLFFHEVVHRKQKTNFSKVAAPQTWP